MARRRGQHNSAFVVVEEDRKGYLVFRLNVKDLFSLRPQQTSEPHPLPPCPVARVQELKFPEHMTFAASPGGARIFAASSESRAIIYDNTTKMEPSPGPDLQAGKFRPVLFAMAGGREVLVTTTQPRFSPGPHFEALRLQAGGHRWRNLPPVPQPPFLLADDDDAPNFPCLIAGFVAGSTVWLTMTGEGTYTLGLDMKRRVWNKEGSWYLPIHGRGIYVPELGLLFGLSSRNGTFCAWDIEAKPPVIRKEWDDDLYPMDRDDFKRYPVILRKNSLAYLGSGRFCISWSSSSASAGHKFDGRLLAHRALEVTRSGDNGELHLRKGKSRCYLMSDQDSGYILLAPA